MQNKRNYSRDEHIILAMLAPQFVEESLDRKRRYTNVDGDANEEYREGFSIIENFDEVYYGEAANYLYCFYANPEVIGNNQDTITWITQNDGNRFGVLADRENLFVLESAHIPSGANLGCALMRFN